MDDSLEVLSRTCRQYSLIAASLLPALSRIGLLGEIDGKLSVVECDPSPFSALGVGHGSGKLTVSAVELGDHSPSSCNLLFSPIGVLGGGPGPGRPSVVVLLSAVELGESNPPFRVIGLGSSSLSSSLSMLARLTG